MMPVSGEEVASKGARDLDALLSPPPPIFHTVEPKNAPRELLADVRIGAEGRSLEAATPVGTIAVELYWSREAETGTDASTLSTQATFQPPLSVNTDPGATDSPEAVQHYPYAALPDGALYGLVVRAPLAAVSQPWSEARTADFGDEERAASYFKRYGTSLSEFRRHFPDVEVGLPEGNYDISVTERTQPALFVAARVENGEPLIRHQAVYGQQVHYYERVIGGFDQSKRAPDTGVVLVNGRITGRDDGKADHQQLQFVVHDGFQRTEDGAERHSGLIEIIVYEGESVQFLDFTFSAAESFIQDIMRSSRAQEHSADLRAAFAAPGYRDTLSSKDESGLSGGLAAGETRYRPPETVKVSTTKIRGLRAIAAFRLALAGERGNLTA